MKLTLSNLISYSTGLMILLLVVKLVLFFAFRSRRWKLHDFFFFSHYHFYLTENPRRETQKRVLNALSLVIGFLIIVILTGLVFKVG